MYFFYIDESGTRDPEVTKVKPDGTTVPKEHLYVLTAVSLFHRQWRQFEREISRLKREFCDRHYHLKKIRFDVADCEVKSTWLRIQKQRERESPFLSALTEADRKKLADTFYAQLAPNHMHLFSVVVDKRKLHSHMDHDKLHKKAYELLLERIEHYLWEFHHKHQGVIVMDDTDKTINRSLSVKHEFFQREGSGAMLFKHIVEYPFFADSKLSNGVQLADLCGYNVYRAFRSLDFQYPYFQKLLPHFYTSQRTDPLKLDGLKVFPDDSDLVEFARKGWVEYKTKQPALL
ncbi:MAG TPA: DUF3800 domain-containing protein [Verrucomicrobiae bacterium]